MVQWEELKINFPIRKRGVKGVKTEINVFTEAVVPTWTVFKFNLNYWNKQELLV